MIEPTLTEQIAARLRDYLADPANEGLNLRILAARFDALPLCVDWGNCWAIKPGGQVVVFSHDQDDPELRIEEDARLVNVALFQGSITYPELRELVPERPPEAEDCPFCTAKGIEPNALGEKEIVCYCGGLGWVPRP
jgi:hypothetical protein